MRGELTRTPSPAASLHANRFVVFDSETTGLDVNRDRIISMGAVAVREGQIWVDDSFEVLIPVSYNSSAVIFHGITREESLAGVPEEQALRLFSNYLHGDVIVGHHIGTDLQILAVSAARFQMKPPSESALDTSLLAHWIQEKAGSVNNQQLARFTLEELCLVYDIPMHDRHTAAGDAYLTAMLFQRLLRSAARLGVTTLTDLSQICQVTLQEVQTPRA